MNQPIVRLENLKKFYDKRLALEIPYLEFEMGEVYALVGPNGAGKTTLLKIINLLEEPTEGTMYFDDQRMSISSADLISMRRQMTLVMQDSILFRTSVYKNIAYGLRVRAFDKESRRKIVMEILKMVGLTGFEDRKARHLSAGESQRVALARALVLEPHLLLLDEPTANVDRRNVQVIESFLKKFNEDRGMTIIFTTHDLSQAYRMTDRVISLLDGKMIGSNPENIFYGEFGMSADRSSFIAIQPSTKIKVGRYEAKSSGIYIDPKDISISPDPPSSDQFNCLEGRITSAVLENGVIRLTVNVGIELVALTDRNGFQHIASQVFERGIYAVFRISDVHVF